MLGKLQSRRNLNQRGDTIIEVLFAITVFSMVVVGGLSIMNQGSAAAQRSLEISLVRHEIDAQAEALRFLNASYVASYGSATTPAANTPAGQWLAMRTSVNSTGATEASDFGVVEGANCPTPPQGSFVINPRRATFEPPSSGVLNPAQTFSQIRYIDDSAQSAISSADGIWVEAIRSASVNDNNQSNAGFIDFHIRACWQAPGSPVPMTLGTIVRLYEPR